MSQVSKLTILSTLALMLCCFGITQAGITLDHVDGLTYTGKIRPNTPITFHLRLYNDAGDKVEALTNGFRIYSPDGAIWTPIVADTTNQDWPFMFDIDFSINQQNTTGSGADTVGFGGVGMPNRGIPEWFDQISFLIHTSVDASQAGKTLCLDSSFFGGAGDWRWATNSGSYFPSWDGPHCFEIAEVPEIVSIYPPPNSIIPIDDLDSILVTFSTDVKNTLLESGLYTNIGIPSLYWSIIYPEGQHNKFRYRPFNGPPGIIPGEILTIVLSDDIRSYDDEIRMEKGYSFSYTIGPSGGSGTFDEPVYVDVGDHPRAIVAYDFNDDDLPDLVTANKNSDNLSVLKNEGDSFTVKESVAGDYAFSLCVIPDSYEKNYLCVANLIADSIYTYQPVPLEDSLVVQGQLMNSDGPSSVCAADFDNDYDFDLATATHLSDDFSIIECIFTNFYVYDTTYTAGNAFFALCAGDFNNDGFSDIAGANNEGTDVSIFMNNGDGTFAPQISVPCDPLGEAIVCADFNGDLWLDLAVAHFRETPDNNLSILLNDGAGGFSVSSTYLADGKPYSLTTADLDADLDMDIAICSWGANGAVIFKNNGDGTFTYDTLYLTGAHADGITAADFNGDGAIDLAVANGGNDNVAILYNQAAVCDCEPGNANGDATINIFDVTYVISYLYKSGPAPLPYEICNGDPNGLGCTCNIFDVTYLISFLYKSGPDPVTCDDWLAACGPPLR